MSDVKKPRPQTGAGLVALAMPKEPEKDLLGQVLGILPIAQATEQMPVDSGAKPGNEFGERCGIVLLNTQHQGDIRVGSPPGDRAGLGSRAHRVFQ
jgi:hypothetical protein